MNSDTQTKIPANFSEGLSFEQQIFFVLSKLKKGSAGEIAAELMELKGVASEDGVADLITHVERQLEKLCAERTVQAIREKHEKKRYLISEKGG